MIRRGAFKALVATVATALVSTSAIAGATKIHPLEGLDPVAYGFNTNTVAAWFRGYQFEVNNDNITVTELGLRMPVAGNTVVLQLWDNATQTLLAQTGNVVSQTNVWQYVSIAPVALTNGGVYTVGIFAAQGGSYFWDNALPPEWYPTGDIEYQTMRYHNSNTSQFPTNTLNGYHYGVTDIGYTIPGPASIALLGLGLGSFARRRRSA